MAVLVRATTSRDAIGVVGVYQDRREVDKGTFKLYAHQRGKEQAERWTPYSNRQPSRGHSQMRLEQDGTLDCVVVTEDRQRFQGFVAVPMARLYRRAVYLYLEL